MRALTLLAVCLPLGGPPAAPPAGWDPVVVGGLTLLVGPGRTTVGLDGVTVTAPVRAAGGTGTATVRRGLTRDVTAVLTELDVRELVRLVPGLPAWLRPKLVGRVGKVTLTVRGDRFELTAEGFRVPGDPVRRVTATGDLRARTVTAKVHALGGLLEYDGRLPSE